MNTPKKNEKLVDFGISSSTDLYEKLQTEFSSMKEKWDKYIFFNFCVTAWHLYIDWLNKDSFMRPRLSTKKKKKTPHEMTIIINIARDIANESKHMFLDNPSIKNKVILNVTQPEIKDWYSYFIRGPQIGISTKYLYLSITDFCFLIMAYFDWIFDDSIPANIFPEKIIEHIKYCETE